MKNLIKYWPAKLAFMFLVMISFSLSSFAAERDFQNESFNRTKAKTSIGVIQATNSFDFNFLGSFINYAAGVGSIDDVILARDAVLTPDVIGMIGLGFGETRVSGRSFGLDEYLGSIGNMAENIIAPEIVSSSNFFKQFRHRVDSVKSYQGGKFATAELTTFLFVDAFGNVDPNTWLPAYAWRCVFQYRQVADDNYMIEHILAAGVPVESIDGGSAVDETWYVDGEINPYYQHLDVDDLD